MNACIELACRIDREALERLEAVLDDCGAQAITLAGGDVPTFDEPGASTATAWSRFEVRALFDAATDRAALASRVRAVCGEGVDVSIERVAERDWADAWKAAWAPQAFAGGLWVCPTFCEPPAEAREVLWLDPGQAFGTGTHETTALCLDWLGGLPDLAGARVLDYGSGSGVLALASAKRGASAVLGVDIDPDAVAIARRNAELNGLAQDVRFELPAAADGLVVDVLVANILLEPLLALGPRFADALAAGGRIALSGLLAEQVPRVLEAYGARFRLDAPTIRGDWALLTGTRRGTEESTVK